MHPIICYCSTMRRLGGITFGRQLHCLGSVDSKKRQIGVILERAKTRQVGVLQGGATVGRRWWDGGSAGGHRRLALHQIPLANAADGAVFGHHSYCCCYYNKGYNYGSSANVWGIHFKINCLRNLFYSGVDFLLLFLFHVV